MKNTLALYKILFFVLISNAAFSKNLYVATDGSNSNPGTILLPLQSITIAATLTVPGDTVIIRQGVHKLSSLIVPNSGTAKAYITYKSYPGDTVTIDGGVGYCMTFTAKQYITLDGLIFTNQAMNTASAMIYMEQSDFIHVINCEFYGMQPDVGGENSSVIRCMGSGPTSFSDSCYFANNYFHDNLAPAMRLYDTKGWIIENNKFVNCEQAIGGKDSPHDMLVRRNFILGSKGYALMFAGQDDTHNVTITENIIVNCSLGFLLSGMGTYGKMRDGLHLYNNTFYNCQKAIGGWDDTYTTDYSFYNNIIASGIAYNYGTGADMPARILNVNKYSDVKNFDTAHYFIDYNCYNFPANEKGVWFAAGKGLMYSNLQSWTTATHFDKHSIVADPDFVFAGIMDFHLNSASKCIGAGKNGEDIGAYPRGNDGTIIGLLPQAVGTNVSIAKVTVSNMQLYPNPWVSGTLFIKGMSDQSQAQIQIHDVQGKLIYQTQFAGSGVDLDRSVIQNSGIYFLTVSGAAGKQTIKLVVQ
ncbi:MAG: T9SS type A sorting domain-containing protein [Bacteroidetes bacterium]|nr:T9SS type A sorting domain-containing protein [Bacteroidota bacterium]